MFPWTLEFSQHFIKNSSNITEVLFGSFFSWPTLKSAQHTHLVRYLGVHLAVSRGTKRYWRSNMGLPGAKYVLQTSEFSFQFPNFFLYLTVLPSRHWAYRDHHFQFVLYIFSGSYHRCWKWGNVVVSAIQNQQLGKEEFMKSVVNVMGRNSDSKEKLRITVNHKYKSRHRVG